MTPPHILGIMFLTVHLVPKESTPCLPPPSPLVTCLSLQVYLIPVSERYPKSFTKPMRALDTQTGQFAEIDPKKERYAILSHTWDSEGEQTYEQLKKVQRRYQSGVQDLQSRSNVAGTHAAAFPKLVRALPEALGRLTESEVEALLRLVAETFGLPIPTPTPSPSDPLDLQVHTPPPSTSSPQSIWDDSELSPKICGACRVAREKGYRYIWIDSCCINKSSSSELSEAINSMYKWYSLAAVCYAYLADVPPGEDHYAESSAFRKSRWFGRGWTLQELIAPLEVEFLSQDWAPISSKHTLVNLVESITNINEKALLHLKPLDAFSVAQRLSWAAKRETTRVEDQAYSLLGLFDINMPTLYGEGYRAFRRLQEKIIQRIPDQSIFAWGNICLPFLNLDYKHPPTSIHFECARYTEQLGDLFSVFPQSFENGSSIRALQHNTTQLSLSNSLDIEYTPTPYGIRTRLPMIPLTQDLLRHTLLGYEDIQLKLDSEKECQWFLAILQCEHMEYPGHLLGRVCYITPSDSNGKVFVYPGCLNEIIGPDIFLLSPETINLFHRKTKTFTVYIPHPTSATLSTNFRLQIQPYTTIKLVLLRETCENLRSEGYSANFRHPDLDNPTMHWLMLLNDMHTITVKLQHALDADGRGFLIFGDIKMARSDVQLDSILSSDQADHRTVCWGDTMLWSELGHIRVTLSALGAGTLTVDLGLDFMGGGYYALQVSVLNEDSLASSAAELEGYQEGEGKKDAAEDLPSERSGIEEAGDCRLAG